MNNFERARAGAKLNRLLAEQDHFFDDLVTVASAAYAKHQTDIVETAQRVRCDAQALLERLHRELE